MNAFSRAMMALVLAVAPVAVTAASMDFEVEAFAHSYAGGGGAGLNTGISFGVGDAFSVSADPADLWQVNSAAQFGFVDADGHTDYIIYAPAAAGGFGTYFDRLVGRIGGSYYDIGLGGSFVAAEAGELFLFNWDSDYAMNAGSVTATVRYDDGAVVPLPAGLPLLLTGIAGIGLIRRKRTA